jgi:hypothetical protein
MTSAQVPTGQNSNMTAEACFMADYGIYLQSPCMITLLLMRERHSEATMMPKHEYLCFSTIVICLRTLPMWLLLLKSLLLVFESIFLLPLQIVA